MLAIIPAAGAGIRLGAKKQFLHLKEMSLLEWVLNSFVESGFFSKIVVPTHLADLPENLKRFKNVDFITGGENRFESVKKGFQHLKPNDSEFVFIHDAARPLVSLDLIKRVMDEVKIKKAVIPITPLYDTIKEVSANQVVATLNRDHLFAVQTPQAFQANLLRNVYESLQGERSSAHFTDEAKALEEIGVPIYTVAGDPLNIKVTKPGDLELAEFYSSQR